MAPRIFRRYLASPRRSIVTFILILIVIAFFKRRKNYNRSESTEYYASERNHKNLDYTATYISKLINKCNSEEVVLNKDVYGNVTENTVIVVIFVENFTKDFKLSLKSLSKINGIEDAFIIFSHSFYDENLNEVIESIQFCRVLQIFYPYSVQTHPEAYPGRHPSDCYSNMNKRLAEEINCTGAHFPDVRGNYRNPINAEKKHHWWWTANHIFENLNCLTNHAGLFIFLEDDYILMPDFIYMATYMKSVAGSLPQCEFLSLGSNSVPNSKENVYALELTTWDPKIHSGVLAFDSTTWDIIESRYDLFCEIDDSSWSRSLNFLSYKGLPGGKFKVMSIKTPRAIKMVGHTYLGIFRYDIKYVIEKIINFQKVHEQSWFPPHLELFINVEIEPDEGDFAFDYSELEGGWADPRDKLLCRNITSAKMKKILLELQNYLVL